MLALSQRPRFSWAQRRCSKHSGPGIAYRVFIESKQRDLPAVYAVVAGSQIGKKVSVLALCGLHFPSEVRGARALC